MKIRCAGDLQTLRRAGFYQRLTCYPGYNYSYENLSYDSSRVVILSFVAPYSRKPFAWQLGMKLYVAFVKDNCVLYLLYSCLTVVTQIDLTHMRAPGLEYVVADRLSQSQYVVHDGWLYSCSFQCGVFSLCWYVADTWSIIPPVRYSEHSPDHHAESDLNRLGVSKRTFSPKDSHRRYRLRTINV